MSVPITQWEWIGTPGHLIVADRCCFHLHTLIGAHCVSTIGCYHPASTDDGRRDPPVTIGSGRLYETMVFKLDADRTVSDWSELDSYGYNDQEAAQRGHMIMCSEWAKR